MNYRFENYKTLINFNDPAIYGISPMVSRELRFSSIPELLVHTNENYIIPVGVKNHPDGWSGQCNGKNIFDNLNEEYLTDLRDGHALLMIDASHEGYHPKWLFNFFHDCLEERSIPPRALIYVTGNAIVDDLYKEWCIDRDIIDKIKCVPYACFEEEIFCTHQKVYTPSVKDHIEYKKNNKTWTFNCPQKRPRGHREQFFDLMNETGIVNSGLCSYPDRGIWIHGEVHDDSNYGQYVTRVHPEYALQTFVTVVSEPQYYSFENSVFNSEKVFKPISCFHPFIILGGKGSLNSMKKRGYRTFSKYFDESYDDIENDKERMNAIIDVLRYIDSIEDKVEWFEKMRGVLTFNYDRFTKNSMKEDVAISEVKKYYKEYFNE